MLLGKWRNTVDVAVKTLKPGAMSAEDFLQEAKLMHKLRHRKLVQLLAVCTVTEPILIITELMIHGALLDYLRKDEGRSLKFVVLVDMASQVCRIIGVLLFFFTVNQLLMQYIHVQCLFPISICPIFKAQ